VELLLQSFREQDGELGVVNELNELASVPGSDDITLTGIPKSTAARREA
jgi:hypothetical protein